MTIGQADPSDQEADRTAVLVLGPFAPLFIGSDHEEAKVVMPDGTIGAGVGRTAAEAISNAIKHANSK